MTVLSDRPIFSHLKESDFSTLLRAQVRLQTIMEFMDHPKAEEANMMLSRLLVVKR